MENSPNSYSIINDIIDKSLENRILCNYTAFLCLEPGIVVDPDETEDQNRWATGEWEEDVLISVPLAESPKFEIKVYPNPFTDRINIEIQLSEEVSANDTQAEIYDLFGKRIKIFNVHEFNGQSKITLHWDATDDNGSRVAKGTYIFICNTPDGRITKKVVLM